MVEQWPIMQRMKVTDDGRVLIDSQEHVFLTATTIPRIHRKMLEIAGPVANTIIYNASFNFSTKMVPDLVRNKPNLPPEKYLDDLLKKLMEFGIGKITFSQYEKGWMVVVEDGFEAEAHGNTGKPMCYMTAGAIAGIFSGVYGKKYSSTEDKCACRGDAKCLFLVKPEGKK